jgi:succinyl-diaminopimelate desuccinylase
VKLLGALAALLPAGDPAIPVVTGLHDCCAAYDGSGLGIACADDVSGPLTFNLGVIHTFEGTIFAQFDIRHPVFVECDINVYDKLPAAASAAGLEASGIAISKGFCIDKKHVLVSTLMGIYNEINESHDEPMAIGGGTYARKLPCAVAYGMLFESDPETAHMADEQISVDSFMKATRIYANAIAELGK